MSDLKTLKDLKANDFDKTKFSVRIGVDNLVLMSDLKYEAKEWIRYLKCLIKDAKNAGADRTASHLGAKIDFINHFFNLED